MDYVSVCKKTPVDDAYQQIEAVLEMLYVQGYVFGDSQYVAKKILLA